MSDSTYITNDEIAAFMVGYMETSGQGVAMAAMAAMSHYRDTAKVTSEEAEGYYYAYIAKKEAN